MANSEIKSPYWEKLEQRQKELQETWGDVADDILYDLGIKRTSYRVKVLCRHLDRLKQPNSSLLGRHDRLKQKFDEAG